LRSCFLTKANPSGSQVLKSPTKRGQSQENREQSTGHTYRHNHRGHRETSSSLKQHYPRASGWFCLAREVKFRGCRQRRTYEIAKSSGRFMGVMMLAVRRQLSAQRGRPITIAAPASARQNYRGQVKRRCRTSVSHQSCPSMRLGSKGWDLDSDWWIRCIFHHSPPPSRDPDKQTLEYWLMPGLEEAGVRPLVAEVWDAIPHRDIYGRQFRRWGTDIGSWKV